MGILSVTVGETGLVGVLPSFLYINTNNTLAQVLAPGYLDSAASQGYAFNPAQSSLVYTTDHGCVLLNISITNGVTSVVFPSGGGGGGAPTTLTYLTQSDETPFLPNSTNLSSFATGFLTNTSAVGVTGSVILTGSGNISISNGTGALNPIFDLTATGVVANTYTNPTVTVDLFGRITTVASGPSNVTSVSGTAGQILSTGGTTPVLSLIATAVAPASYTNASFTVDAFGRLTAASSGTAPVTSVSGTAGEISSTGGTTPILALVNTAVTPGAYTYTSMTVDSFGRVTSASSGTAPVTSVSGTMNQIDSTGGLTPVLSLSNTTVFPGTVTLNADPTLPLQAATKQYVDAATAGLNIHGSCLAGTTANLVAVYNNGVSGVGATLTNSGAFAVFTVDGVTPPLNARILVKNQIASADNGIYTLTTVGDAVSVNWVLTRATDYNSVPNVEIGDFSIIVEGTVNAATGWIQTSIVATIGTDPIVFTEFGVIAIGVTSVTGTPGQIDSTGGATPVISIDPTYLGQTSITTLGTISTGTWHGSVIAPTYGGTGVNNNPYTITLGGNVSTGGTLTTAAALTTLGAFGTTFTFTAPTSVTFPTSGLLATSTTLGTVTTGVWNATIISPTYGGTGINNGTFTATWGGNVTTGGVFSTADDFSLAGAFPSTFTLTAPTSVTFPTSGLLATSTTLGTVTTGVWQASIIQPTWGGTGINNGVNTITVGGNLVTAGALTTLGAYTSTFTMTGATNVTFPTSGLLATSTTLGTVTTGVWNATPITVSYGGTGNTTFTPYSVILAGTTATSPFQNVVGVGTSGQVLTSAGAGAIPTWATPFAGTVSSVSGTVGQIDVANGTTTPVISIDPAYIGQASINTVGTIGTGVWNGTPVTVPYGGTGDASFTAYALVTGGMTTTGALQSVATLGTLGQVLTSAGAGALPTWTTPTTGTVTSVSGTAGQIVSTGGAAPVISIDPAYAGQASIVTVGTIATGTWNGTGLTVPYGGTGDASFTAYSVICGGTTATGALQAVASVGTTGQVLTSQGAGMLPTWAAASSGTVTTVTGTANRITSTGGTAPQIDISAAYVGQASITTVGTIATGTWNGTLLSPTYGGTGVNNGANTLTLAGSLTTTGAFAATFNISAATNVTFPTSGTLLTATSLANYAVLNATNNFAFNEQYQMNLQDYSETVSALGSVSGAVALNLNNGNVFSATATANVTLSITNVPVSGTCASISLISTNFGAYTITWPAGTTWLGGSAPTLPASGIAVLVFFTVNNGTTWYANLVGSGGSGTVTFVSGTAGQISVANGTTTPVISIDTGYLGQNSITTVGTVTSGIWHGAAVNVAYGGTGEISFTPYSVICGGTISTSPLQTVATLGTTGQVLTSQGAGNLPVWSNASAGTVTSVSGTGGQIDVSNGTTTPVISIDPAYVGQVSINTVGTIGTGTWNATIISPTAGGTGVNNGAKTITLGGSLTTSGAYASTFTMTGTTNVTFPTSGTLSTTTGTVTSVSGTVGQISVATGTTTPVISIDATYVGQTSITTLGTVSTGTWAASLVSPTYGGTGVNNGAKTITLGGNLTTSGAFASTFTMTGATNVTFPTSGTLSTTTGTVTSVTGTVGQISVATGTTTPVISIDATYVGQTSITTLGTIATGTWNASLVAGQYGGTGVANTGKTITLGGNLTTSGAFASTFTMTAATSVTFPTSGTLATSTTLGTVTTGTWNATVIAGQYGGTGVANTGKTITLGGNLTTSGAFASTFTMTAATAVTFPTSGTLATSTTLGTVTTGVWNATIISPTYGGTGVNNGANTLTLAGNLATSGAFASTFTMTGATAVTFPTSGTLATTTTLGTVTTGTWNATVISPTYGGTGVNNGANTLTLAGNLATSGAFASTFTMTGATSVTFPTSGTLATTANTAVTNATNSFAFNQQYQMKLQDYSETVSVLGSISGATALNLQNGNIFTGTVTGATTLSVTNVPASGTCASLSFIITNGGSAAITWPAGTKWPGGTAPTLTASGTDTVIGYTVNGGTTWYFNAAGLAYA